ncbi:hypothetical protein [uncultured Tenacibaculum sp.]|uniref:hypothetical protein n=1 Tax=uncultured Tenacibaculum sp. TaxID=174713 RepID=UPI0026060787|nr:hypothetical protein [uncultured Tenacibaculum sp.]
MKQNKEILKQFFETGDKPTQQQYADLIDSYIDAKQPQGEANRRFVIDEAGEVSVATQLATPDYQAGTNVTIDTSNPLQPIISASVGGASTGLEQVTEEGKKGWRLVGRNPSNYGSIGTNAVDLSINDYGSSTKGATGNYSHSEGLSTSASGIGSHSEGQNTAASGDKSHAEGNLTIASGDSSHAGGMYNTAPSFCERTIGMFGTNYTPNSDTLWNATDRLFNIGNGTDNLSANRSDAFTVLKNGTITAPSLTNTLINTAGNKSLITKEYADANYAGGGTTDLSYEVSTRKLVSSTGKDTILPLADATNAGLMKANFYEEGIFTPTLIDLGGGATYTSNTSKGKYVRVGNKITFSVNISGINTVGTPTGQFRVGALPFEVVDNHTGNVITFSGGNEEFYAIHPAIYSSQGNIIAFNKTTSNTSGLSNSGNDFVFAVVFNNGIVQLAGTYITNVYTS